MPSRAYFKASWLLSFLCILQAAELDWASLVLATMLSSFFFFFLSSFF